MTVSDLIRITIGFAQGMGAISIFLLVLFIGVCVLLTLTKFRSTRNSLTIKSLDELVGEPIHYLPASTPRGTSDQLTGSRAPLT